MKIENLNEAINEAKRFLKKSKELKKEIGNNNVNMHWASKYKSAVKRSSMDLTRSLSKLRNDIY